MKSGERRRKAASDDRGGKGLVVGNIGEEAPEIDVLPVEQPVPAEHESTSAEPEPVPAEAAPPLGSAPAPETEPAPGSAPAPETEPAPESEPVPA
jgi:outer membrane biosynthesis protein TonB